MEQTTTTILTDTGENNRLHYMDNLRALAMTLGLFFHASLAYSPLASSFWLPANDKSSVSLDVILSFSHIFRMPLFFVISGFFALMLIEKRGIRGYLWHRTKRILFPFIVFTPIILALMFASIVWAIQNIENLSPLLGYIKNPPKGDGAADPKITTLHLWFLYNLFFFSVLLALIAKFSRFKELTKLWLNNKTFLLVIFPTLLIPALISQPLPYPPPDKFYPQLWSFGYFGMFFLLGSVLYINRELIHTLKPYTILFLILSVVCHAIIYAHHPESVTIKEVEAYFSQSPDITVEHAIHALFISVSSCFMCYACIIWGHRFLNRSNKVLRFISNSSYWVYIIHIPLLFFVQFLFLDIPWNPWGEFIATSLITFAIALVSYRLFVSRTFVGWMLNGRKKQPQYDSKEEQVLT